MNINVCESLSRFTSVEFMISGTRAIRSVGEFFLGKGVFRWFRHKKTP